MNKEGLGLGLGLSRLTTTTSIILLHVVVVVGSTTAVCTNKVVLELFILKLINLILKLLLDYYCSNYSVVKYREVNI